MATVSMMGEVFSPLLWCIFYDPLLCEVKRQESVCEYRLVSYYILKNGHAEFQAGLSSFFVADAFVDDTIWVESSQTTTQHILDVASEFYQINDISINNDKTVTIPFNCHVNRLSLYISGVSITIAKKGESHHYLGIFLSTEGLLKSSLAKAYSDLKDKVASLICFANAGGVLGHLFSHRSYDLQVLCWYPVHPLCFPVYIYVSHSNNFLVDIVRILLENSLSLGGYLGNSFLSCGGVPMSAVLVASLPPHPPALDAIGFPNIVSSQSFNFICSQLSLIVANTISVYTDGSLKSLDTFSCRADAGVFFEDIGLELGVSVLGSMSSTLAEMQAIALALECVPSSGSIHLFSDSQPALDACKSELGLICPDFCNRCWVECRHICLPLCLNKRFLLADGGVVSANSRHVVRDIFYFINCAYWEIGLDSKFLPDSLLSDVDWYCFSFIWHPDSHMASGFTSKSSIDLCTYFMKALHHWLPVTVRKCLYDRRYSSMLYLHCSEMEVSDHVFVCEFDHDACCQILDSHVGSWSALSGLSVSSSGVLQLLSTCVSDVSVSMVLFKNFVFNGWYHEAIFFCSDPKIACLKIVKFVQSLGAAFRTEVWLVCVKYRAFMKKNGHIFLDGLVSVPIFVLSSMFSIGVVRLLGVAEAIGVHFGYCKQCAFFFGVGNSVVVHIDV
ncbi:hypothetical protein G9A89_022676 [Geosiphon pyriformis]|nr:hypothetical protein G9A89_022676 [Geosiphon pyriformis]